LYIDGFTFVPNVAFNKKKYLTAGNVSTLVRMHTHILRDLDHILNEEIINAVKNHLQGT